MGMGGQNQTNRNGHGVAGASQVATGVVTISAATEVALGTIMNSVIAGSSMDQFAPFEVRILSVALGGSSPLEVRTKTGVSGFPIVHAVSGGGADPDPLTLYLAQNKQSPNTRVLIANPNAAADLNLFVMVLG